MAHVALVRVMQNATTEKRQHDTIFFHRLFVLILIGFDDHRNTFLAVFVLFGNSLLDFVNCVLHAFVVMDRHCWNMASVLVSIVQ
jgi:hypothetical protein